VKKWLMTETRGVVERCGGCGEGPKWHIILSQKKKISA